MKVDGTEHGRYDLVRLGLGIGTKSRDTGFEQGISVGSSPNAVCRNPVPLRVQQPDVKARCKPRQSSAEASIHDNGYTVGNAISFVEHSSFWPGQP
jgi:hypothetical protein